jgi:hypothetical protein
MVRILTPASAEEFYPHNSSRENDTKLPVGSNLIGARADESSVLEAADRSQAWVFPLRQARMLISSEQECEQE